MQTTQTITLAHLDKVLDSVFTDGNPVVKQAYSEFDTSTKMFPDVEALRTDLNFSIGQKKKFFYYSIYYPDAKGVVTEKRINLKPGAVKGHTYRYSQEGWGLVFLQFNFRNYPAIECNVSANSAARARNWATTNTERDSPDLWDWKVINCHAGRLVRLLRKLAKQAEPQR